MACQPHAALQSILCGSQTLVETLSYINENDKGRNTCHIYEPKTLLAPADAFSV